MGCEEHAGSPAPYERAAYAFQMLRELQRLVGPVRRPALDRALALAEHEAADAMTALAQSRAANAAPGDAA
jgi:hypothetical protein